MKAPSRFASVAVLACCLGAGEAAAAVEMRGTVSWRIADDAVTLEIERIENNGTSSTGELHVTMWLTEGADPYTTGWRAARQSLAYIDGAGTLGPGWSYGDIRFTTDYRAPPAGTYYIHVFVSETPDVDRALDLVTFTNTLTVGEEDDHGDAPADATPIRVPSVTRGNLGHPGDRDVFRVRVERPGWLGVATTGTTDTHGTLRDADGTIVGTDDDEGDGLNFFIAARVGPGDWFIEVRGFDGRVTGRYGLVVVFLPDPIPPAHDAPSRHLGDFDGDGRDDVLLRHSETG